VTGHDRKLLVGFTLAPLASTAAAFVWMGGSLVSGLGPSPSSTAREFLEGFGFLVGGVLTVAILVNLFFGVPAFLWLRKRNRITLSAALLAGATVGVVPFALTFAGLIGLGLWRIAFEGFEAADRSKELFEAAPAAIWWLLLGAFSGTAGALLFWFIAIRGQAPPGPRLPPANPAL
jgi:hypothetical protein